MKTKSIFKSCVSILLTLCILFSMTAVGLATVSAATSGEPVGGIKQFAIDKMLDIGLRVACEGVVAVSEASAKKGNDGISKTTALIAEWGLMSAEEAATTKNIELCEEILYELQGLAETTQTGISNISTDLAQLKASFTTENLNTRQNADIKDVIADLSVTGGVLEHYDEYIEVAAKYSDGLASRDEMLDAQYRLLFELRNYAGITTAVSGATTEEKLASVSQMLFGDTANSDNVNADLEGVIGALSANLITDTGIHTKNVMIEAMDLAASYFPFSHQQYNFVRQQVGYQIQTIVKILTMYNEVLALQYGYLTETDSLLDEDLRDLLTTYNEHIVKLNDELIPGVLNNINTMLSAKYDLSSIGITMSIDDYMKPEDAVVTNLKTENFVHDYAQNSIWGEYHSYRKLMTTTYGTKHSVYYLLNDTRGMADLYDYKYGNPEHGPNYSNITADINDGCNIFSLPEVTGDHVDYDNFFGTNAFPLRKSVIRNYLFDFESNGLSYPLLRDDCDYLLTKKYTEKHGHVDKSYVVDVDTTQTASNSIQAIGFTPSDDPSNRDYSTYFTSIFAPTDTYKQKVTAEVSGAIGTEIQIVANDSENREITISNGNSGIVPSGNELIIKMKLPENVGKVSLSCIRDHDAYNISKTDPSTEIFDETLLDYLTVEDGYYIFKCKMPYSQCTFKLHADALDENDNIIIKTYSDLCVMAKKVNGGDNEYVNGKYILANDIDCKGYTLQMPIGTDDIPFSGTFDGQNYTISNLKVNGEVYCGLFGCSNGTIVNLNLNECNVNGSNFVGGICGYNQGTITNCSFNGTVVGENSVGGICGYSEGSILKSYNSGSISGKRAVGGISGVIDNSTINNCYNTGKISSTQRVGGIVGSGMREFHITNCYNVGAISGNEMYGPICGNREVAITINPTLGIIANCFYIGDSETDSFVGTSFKTAEQFKSGEVAYLLNNIYGISSWAWFQNLDNGEPSDDFPTLTYSYNNLVLKVDREDRTYSNIPNGYLLGDVDLNGDVDIMDATLIQKHCAKLYTLTGASLANADAVKDSVISISDATMIQAYVAGIVDSL